MKWVTLIHYGEIIHQCSKTFAQEIERAKNHPLLLSLVMAPAMLHSTFDFNNL